MTAQNTSLPRRLGAILYDLLLVMALLMLGTLPFIGARAGESVEPGNFFYQLTMFGIVYLFYVGFWCGYGRTLGMQSWRLKIEDASGNKPGVGAASLRFFASVVSLLPAGLGFLWQLWDRDHLTWHDRLSGTQLRHYPKPVESQA